MLRQIFGGKAAANEKRKTVKPNPVQSGSLGKIKTVEEAIKAKPDWVKRQISTAEAKSIVNEIRASKSQTAIEVGVASGFSSAVLFSALAENGPEPKLYALDWAKQCYYDKSRLTGDAFYEIHGKVPGYSLTTGLHTGVVGDLPTVDFCFIDANHQNPWPALDLMSLGRFLKPGATVALHDVEMIYHSWGRHASGARDIYRSWLGEKWRMKSSSNVGFIRYDHTVMMKSVVTAFMTDWDLEIKADHVAAFVEIARSFPAEYSAPIIKALTERADSSKDFAPREDG